MLPEFIETPLFTKQVDGELSAAEFLSFQAHLTLWPNAGAVIPGSGGLRKVRWRWQGRGKRGGVRIVYFWRSAAGKIWLLYLYPKNVREDLSPVDLRRLRRLVDEDAN